MSTSSNQAITALSQTLQAQGYFADRRLATAAYLSLELGRPLLLEGEPGVGKTELAKALAAALNRPLVRLQCYDGLELRDAAYEWNYAAQLLALKAESESESKPGSQLYEDRFLIERPLLRALRAPAPGVVLLIDEVDRADEPFEAFLLEYLGEFQLSIPELGTVSAHRAPLTLLTSNRTRDLNDAIKRRCLYHWLDYPERERELAIVRARVPQASAELTDAITRFVDALRKEGAVNFTRAPGIAESVEWARALVALNTLTLDPEIVADTAGILFKHREDTAALNADKARELLEKAAA